MSLNKYKAIKLQTMKLIKLNTKKEINKLNHLPFNRKFKVRNDLIEKMNQYGFTVPILVLLTDIVNGITSKWIVDGQHRLSTAIYLNITPYAVVKTSEELGLHTMEDIVKYVASLNSASKAWNLLNYVESYNYLNYKEYRKLLELTNKSPYSVNTIGQLLYGIRGRGYCTKQIKEGNFVANNYSHVKNCLALAAHLSKYQRITSRMIISLNYVCGLKTFNKNKFIMHFIKNSNQLNEMQLDDYTDIFSSWIK